MKNPNLFLPGFHLATLRRRPRSASQRLADQLTKLRQNSISQLAQCFTGFIPAQLLQPQQSGAQSRQRIFSKENTFWGFFSQILNADGGCSEVVRQFHAVAASRNKPLPSSSTSAYCQARLKLVEYDLLVFSRIHQIGYPSKARITDFWVGAWWWLMVPASACLTRPRTNKYGRKPGSKNQDVAFHKRISVLVSTCIAVCC